VTLAANQTVLAKSFGNFKMGAISGTIFEDKNGNGHFDKGEGGLAGWTIQLVKPDGTITTTTGGNDGKYSFINLSPGNYKVSEVQQTGWQQTTSNPFGIKINSGTNSTGNDFGNRKR
jgi:uncharacterized protein (DUF2141 family)